MKFWKARRKKRDSLSLAVLNSDYSFGGAVAQLGARLDGIEEVVGSNPIGSTIYAGVRPGRIGNKSYWRHDLHLWALKEVVEGLQSFSQIRVAGIVLSCIPVAALHNRHPETDKSLKRELLAVKEYIA